MNSSFLSIGRPRVAAVIATLALMGMAGSGHAEEQQVVLAASVDVPGPAVFVPSAAAEAEFESAFAAFENPSQPVVAEHAVDISTITPAAPLAEAAGSALGSGVASYYADRFNGRRTASGETFSNAGLTAAHRTLPFGSRVRVTNPRTGASVVVRINDRGPFSGGRTIDLSRAAAEAVGIVRAGHGTVELALLD